MNDRDEFFSEYSYNSDGHVFNKHGKRVGSYTKKYGRLCTKYGEVSISRLLMFMHNGEWPEGEVDHINGDTHDDRLCNLRVCSRAENSKNRRAYINNTTGFKGVHCQRYKGEIVNFIAIIQVDGNKLYLGTFPTKELAALAYNEAATKHHGAYASLNLL